MLIALALVLCLTAFGLISHPMMVSADGVTAGDFTVTGGVQGTDYTYESNTLTVLTSTDLAISGTTTSDRIVVNTGVTAYLTLDNVNIQFNDGDDASAKNGTSAIEVLGSANIYLIGTNTLKSGYKRAGLEVKDGASVTISTSGSEASISATGGGCGAGIGGGEDGGGGEIVIDRGIIFAVGGAGAAGIGSGCDSDRNDGVSVNCGTITINGGTVTATGGEYGAGIGSGGDYISAGAITVTGGTVTATGGLGAAGIGSGFGGAGGNIIISGGTVTANGGVDSSGKGGDGIGNGYGSTATNCFSTGTNGNAMIMATSIDESAKSEWSGMIFEGTEGAIYGTTLSLSTDATIPAGYTLTIAEGQTLNVSATLTNDGTIINNGTLSNSGTIFNDGTLTNNGTLSGTEVVNRIKINATNFPDDNFRNYVSREFDDDGDGALTEAERNAVRTINANGMGIASMVGVEYFPEVTTLNCIGNGQIQSLDVSMLTKLTELDCSENQISELKLNEALTTLYCGNNCLTTLDVTKLTNLANLECDTNSLSSLDFGNLTKLEVLECGNNGLTSLDLTGLTNLANLIVDNNAGLGTLDVSQNKELMRLSCRNIGLRSLDVSNNTKLQKLDCSDNALTSLNVTGLTNLTELICSNNRLLYLDLTTNTQLTTFSAIDQSASIEITPGYMTYTFPAGVEGSRAYGFSSGAKMDSSDKKLTVDSGTTQVTYSYHCADFGNNSFIMPVTLTVTNPHTHVFNASGICSSCGRADWSYPTATPAIPFAGGTGTANDPYIIATAQ